MKRPDKQSIVNLTSGRKLMLVKTIHTLIWLFFNFVIGYMFYAALAGKMDKWLWIGYGLVLAEGLVLAIFRFRCPLTIIARKYSYSKKDNFDIYLPNWLARNTKRIYTTLALIITLIVIFRLLTK